MEKEQNRKTVLILEDYLGPLKSNHNALIRLERQVNKLDGRRVDELTLITHIAFTTQKDVERVIEALQILKNTIPK